MSSNNEKPSDSRKKLVGKLAEKFGVEPLKFWETLKSTAFKQRNGNPPTDEQMMALLIVSDQYGLNPFLKEIYAFPDKDNGIVPVVGIDGWSRIINSHSQFDGMEFRTSETTIELKGLTKPVFEWIECIMYRKDRQRPTVIREYLEEIYREPIEKRGQHGPYVIKGPWQTHPRRFSRHKVIIQTARVALGYTGIYDEDEAERIISGDQIAASNAPSIEFDSNPIQSQPQSLPKPQSQNELMQDLAQAEFDGMVTEEAAFVSVEQHNNEPFVQVQASTQTNDDAPKPNEVVETNFGQIKRKDVQMINQMIDFTSESGTWDTTKDSFNERYSDETLSFALEQLNNAFNTAFPAEK